MKLLLTLSLLIPTLSQSDALKSELTLGHKLAPWSSLLLPGTGELLRGYPLKGEIFLWADGLAIAGAAGFGWDAASKKSAATGMAMMFAGANPVNRSSTYLVAMEGFMSSDDYNLAVSRDARRLYPDDLEAQQQYIAENSYIGDDAWMWSSDSLREAYLDYRAGMRRAQQTSQAFLGLMVFTRLVSMLDVTLFSPPRQQGLGLVPSYEDNRPGLQLIYRF